MELKLEFLAIEMVIALVLKDIFSNEQLLKLFR